MDGPTADRAESAAALPKGMFCRCCFGQQQRSFGPPRPTPHRQESARLGRRFLPDDHDGEVRRGVERAARPRGPQAPARPHEGLRLAKRQRQAHRPSKVRRRAFLRRAHAADLPTEEDVGAVAVARRRRQDREPQDGGAGRVRAPADRRGPAGVAHDRSGEPGDRESEGMASPPAISAVSGS